MIGSVVSNSRSNFASIKFVIFLTPFCLIELKSDMSGGPLHFFSFSELSTSYL